MQKESNGNVDNTKFRTAYIHLSNGKIETTKEILGGKVYADFDASGKLIGFEFLDPLKIEIDGELK